MVPGLLLGCCTRRDRGVAAGPDHPARLPGGGCGGRARSPSVAFGPDADPGGVEPPSVLLDVEDDALAGAQTAEDPPAERPGPQVDGDAVGLAENDAGAGRGVVLLDDALHGLRLSRPCRP